MHQNNILYSHKKNLLAINQYIIPTINLTFDRSGKFLIFKNKGIFLRFRYRLENLIHDLKQGVFIKIILRGVGYNCFVFKNYIIFDLGFSHYIALKIPTHIVIKRFKARFICFSYNSVLLNIFLAKIFNLRKLNIYKGKGVYNSDTIIKLKEINKK